MAKLGKAYYCDGCGVEIVDGDQCVECDPDKGSEEVSFWFIARKNDEQTPEESNDEWPKRRWFLWG